MNLYLVTSRIEPIRELVAAESPEEAENMVAEAHGLDVGHPLAVKFKYGWVGNSGIIDLPTYNERQEIN